MIEAVRLPEGQMRIEKVLADGRRMVVRRKRPPRMAHPGATAIHEAEHAVPGKDDVIKATIKPGPGYSGATWFTRFNAAAAAAPHAHGRGGTGFDVEQIRRAGHSLGAAMSAGRAALSGKDEHVLEVAKALQEEETLSGNDIRRIIQEVDEGFEVIIEIHPAPAALGKKPLTLMRKVRGGMLTLTDLPRENS